MYRPFQKKTAQEKSTPTKASALEAPGARKTLPGSSTLPENDLCCLPISKSFMYKDDQEI